MTLKTTIQKLFDFGGSQGFHAETCEGFDLGLSWCFITLCSLHAGRDGGQSHYPGSTTRCSSLHGFKVISRDGGMQNEMIELISCIVEKFEIDI